ncbi:ABC transporter permease [Vineibacter terrae]|uniref:ABC transporter permease n=1 Tax=Vineibacter terrae TaxID=2586908 RepID=UPI002E36B1C9|nr:ABC transporter permease [Vineibacter terrae]HEX2891240.1 ABC transporter permease [Vineibacter terrae]
MVAISASAPMADDGPEPAAAGSPLKVLGIGLPLAYALAFFVAPLAFLIVLGFWLVEDFQVVPAFSLENYRDIAQHMFAKSSYALAIAQSLWVSLSTAVLAVVVCYPMVLAIVYLTPPSRHRLFLMLAVAPFWSSYVLRLFSWQILLAKKGIINSALAWAGLEHLQISLIYTQTATRIGLIHYLAPILIVVLYVTVASIDRDLIQAARDLGATRWQAFRRVILPMSRTGLLVSASFAAIVSFGDVLAGALLGGGAGTSILGSVPLFSNMIMTEYASSTNLPRTSALAMILVLVMVVMLAAGAALAERSKIDAG